MTLFITLVCNLPHHPSGVLITQHGAFPVLAVIGLEMSFTVCFMSLLECMGLLEEEQEQMLLTEQTISHSIYAPS